MSNSTKRAKMYNNPDYEFVADAEKDQFDQKKADRKATIFAFGVFLGMVGVLYWLATHAINWWIGPNV